MNLEKIQSTRFTDRELLEAYDEAENMLQDAIELGSQFEARQAHIYRTALRRWMDERRAKKEAAA